MAIYTKDFLVDAFCFRYEESLLNTKAMREQAATYYDTVDKKKFRESCSLDAAEIARYAKFAAEWV